MAIVVTELLNLLAFLAATFVKSFVTLSVGKPEGRVHAVVLSTTWRPRVFPPVVMFLINVPDTYFADILKRGGSLTRTGIETREDGVAFSS